MEGYLRILAKDTRALWSTARAAGMSNTFRLKRSVFHSLCTIDGFDQLSPRAEDTQALRAFGDLILERVAKKYGPVPMCANDCTEQGFRLPHMFSRMRKVAKEFHAPEAAPGLNKTGRTRRPPPPDTAVPVIWSGNEIKTHKVDAIGVQDPSLSTPGGTKIGRTLSARWPFPSYPSFGMPPGFADHLSEVSV